ncbi:hypothetical protein ACIQOV_04245 [Kitasatospora sp. NPDC091257]|uniref:hypothetical protein n=1 Tax=Kitasatospora sp. NPDC091257 TaxID=3364084 RepID=UPI0037F4925D
MTTEQDTVATWNTYGNHQLARGLELPGLDRWDWGVPGPGPGMRSSAWNCVGTTLVPSYSGVTV